MMEHFGMTDMFEDIVGGELDGGGSDKTAVIQKILGSAPNKDDYLMIGDTKYDIIRAKNNGIDSVDVTSGYGKLAELENAHPTYICM